jgi:hypothetical protein
MNRLVQAIMLVCISAVTALTACASAGAKGPCTITPQDSIYVGREPVYEECAVERKAKLATTDVKLDYRPSMPPTVASGCMLAEVRYVVDVTGHPEPPSIRLLSSNDREFGDAVLARVLKLRYEPATIAGRPVRQIVTDKQSLGFTTVRVVASSPTAGPPPISRSSPGARAPNC